MKILYFFELFDGNFIKAYHKLKKRELNRNENLFKKKYNNIEFTFYCLNKSNHFLIQNQFPKDVKSLLNEHIHIPRNKYNKVIQLVWNKIRKTFQTISSSRFSILNKFWNIMEYKITKELLNLFERIEFIKANIKRENPDLIIFSQRKPLLHDHIKSELKSNKFIFIRSRIDKIYLSFNKFLDNIHEFIMDFVDTLKFTLNSEIKEKKSLKPDQDCYIGISAPGNYFYSMDLKVLSEGFKENGIKFYHIRGIYDLAPTAYNLKYKWHLKAYNKDLIKKRLMRLNKKGLIVPNMSKPLEKMLFMILIKVLDEELIRVLYVLETMERVLKSSNYKIIIILNEFGEIGKITCDICKRLGIIVYFIPYAGIIRRESDVTPYLSDFICVEGKYDKEYLVQKGVNPDKIFIRGSARYEPILQKKINPIDELKDHLSGKIYRITNKKKLIVLATNTFSNESNWITIKKVVEAIRDLKGIEFIIKLHPHQEGIFVKQCLEKLKFNAPIVKNVNLFELLKTADLFLTEESSVILDSMVMETPLICLDFVSKGIYYSAKHVYNDERFLITVRDEKELRTQLDIFLKTPKTLKEYQDTLKSNLSYVLYHKEGYSTIQQIINDLKTYIKKS